MSGVTKQLSSTQGILCCLDIDQELNHPPPNLWCVSLLPLLLIEILQKFESLSHQNVKALTASSCLCVGTEAWLRTTQLHNYTTQNVLFNRSA